MATRAQRGTGTDATEDAAPLRLTLAHLEEALPAPILARISDYIDAIERLSSPRFAAYLAAVDTIDSSEANIPWSEHEGRKIVSVDILSRLLERRLGGTIDPAVMLAFCRDLVCVWQERGAELVDGQIVWPPRPPSMTLKESVTYWRRVNAAKDGRQRLAALSSIMREATEPPTDRPRI
jgi:hypothetical protein